MDESRLSENTHTRESRSLSPFFEKMSFRSEVLPKKVQQYVAVYRYSGGLKSWAPDDVPGTPQHFGRKGMHVFLYGKAKGPKVETLGFLDYVVTQLKSGWWIIQVLWLSTDGATEVLARSAKFSNQGEVWCQLSRWCRDKEWQVRLFGPDSCRFIPEAPLGAVLERRYFKNLIETRIEFERRLQPFFYQLCLRMDGAQTYHEYSALYAQIDNYKLLDKIIRGEKLSEQEECTLSKRCFPVEFGAAHEYAIKLAKCPQLSPQLQKFYEELVKPYISRGYVFLPRLALRYRIEEKLGMRLRQDAFERRLQRYNLWCTLKSGAQDLACRWYLANLESEAEHLANESIHQASQLISGGDR